MSTLGLASMLIYDNIIPIEICKTLWNLDFVTIHHNQKDYNSKSWVKGRRKSNDLTKNGINCTNNVIQ